MKKELQKIVARHSEIAAERKTKEIRISEKRGGFVRMTFTFDGNFRDNAPWAEMFCIGFDDEYADYEYTKASPEYVQKDGEFTMTVEFHLL